MSNNATSAAAPSVSIVVACYNARGKIERCLASLERIDSPASDFNVIFVDDCSTDGTYEFLCERAEQHLNWSVLRLDENSGSPSKPRNTGVRASTSEFVFFLDCDDEIYPETVRVHLQHARSRQADIVRGYLVVDDGKTLIDRNKIDGWEDKLSPNDRIRLIISKQSTTTPSLIRRSLLIENDIVWPEKIRIGEDTLFLIEVLSHANGIEYLDHPTFIYHKAASWTPSTTQSYGEKELKDHLEVWRTAESKLQQRSVSFFAIRLQVGLQTVIKSLIWHNRGDIMDETYSDLSDFVSANWDVIGKFAFNARNREICETIRGGDLQQIRQALRPRMVISGYDLKFARQVEHALEKRFDIRFDEWTGHATHDEKQSLEMLGWAEVIWCEWLLENAVWWSKRKQKNQVLVARMHAFECGRDFGTKVDIKNIDAVLCVSVFYIEKLLETFGYERRKARLLPNALLEANFKPAFSQKRTKNLAIIGVLPSQKGLLKALEILAQLRKDDSDYSLHVYGKSAAEVPWVAKDPKEKAYFESCDNFITDNDLTSAVHFHGHTNIAEALHAQKIGFVLSVSAHESFHLAPAEGFAGGAQGVFLDWDGVEYIYPERFVFGSTQEIADYILEQQAPAAFKKNAKFGRDFVSSTYTGERFLDLVTATVREFC